MRIIQKPCNLQPIRLEAAQSVTWNDLDWICSTKRAKMSALRSISSTVHGDPDHTGLLQDRICTGWWPSPLPYASVQRLCSLHKSSSSRCVKRMMQHISALSGVEPHPEALILISVRRACYLSHHIGESSHDLALTYAHRIEMFAHGHGKLLSGLLATLVVTNRACIVAGGVGSTFQSRTAPSF